MNKSKHTLFESKTSEGKLFAGCGQYIISYFHNNSS